MRIEDLMTHIVHTCFEDDTLEQAAHAMWEWDIGCLVVIDRGRRPIGVITDRDIAMAAYTQGVRLRDAHVSSSMSSEVVTCYPGTPLPELEAMMQKAQVRRVPVIDVSGMLVGIVTLADIAHFAQLSRIPMSESPGVTNTLGNITRPRRRQISPEKPHLYAETA